MSDTLIKFHCPHCDHKIEAESRLGGENFPCPSCGKRLVIPARTIGPGIVLGGYRLERLLGKGGMGEVYLAYQVAMDRRVAVKVLNPELVRDREYVGRFMNEVRLLARLDHPHIVTAIDAGQEGGTYFLAMTYVEGKPMALRLDDGQFLPEAQAVTIAAKMASALSYAWDKHQLLHRDVKPSNILIDDHDEPKLTDLGVSKTTTDTDHSFTVTGMVVGTPYYMSPEQARGDQDVDFRSDLYSLGATLYHMVTGHVPFDGDASMAIISKVLTDPFPNPKRFNPQVSYGCAQVLRVMMEKAPEDRYDSWADAITDLKLVARGRPPKLAPRLIRRAKGRRRRAPLQTVDGMSPVAEKGRGGQGVGLLIAIMVALTVAAGTLGVLVLRQPQKTDQQSPNGGTAEVHDPILPTWPVTDTAPAPVAISDTTPLNPVATVDPPVIPVDPPADPVTPPIPAEPIDPGDQPVDTPIDDPTDPANGGGQLADLHANLTDMLEKAAAFHEENPEDFDRAIARYSDIVLAGAGTPFKWEAEAAIEVLEAEREGAITNTMKGLREQVAPLVEAHDYDAAVAVYRDYDGPYAELTTKQRQHAIRGLRRQSQDHDEVLAQEQVEAQAAYRELVAAIAKDMADLQPQNSTARIVALRRSPLEAHIRQELSSLSESVTRVQAMYERIRQNLRDATGPVKLKFKDQTVTGEVVHVTGPEIRLKVTTNEAGIVGSFERTFKLSDLKLDERVRLLGLGEEPYLQVMRGLLCHAAGDADRADRYLALADSDLGHALRAELTSRRSAAVSEDAQAALTQLLADARLARDDAQTPAALVDQLRANTYTRAEILRLQESAAAFLRRYGETPVAVTYQPLFDAIAAMRLLAWPNVPKQHLLFLWENNLALNKVADPRGIGTLRCDVTPAGKARIGEENQMSLDGGAFQTGDYGPILSRALRQSNAFTLELMIHPTAGDQGGPARILSLSDGANSRNLTLGQDGRKLMIRLRTTERHENGTPDLQLGILEGDGPFHIIVTYADGLTRCFINGRQVLESNELTGALTNWEPMDLIFGNETSGDRPWTGDIWDVVIQNRALSQDEAEAQYTLHRKSRED